MFNLPNLLWATLSTTTLLINYLNNDYKLLIILAVFCFVIWIVVHRTRERFFRFFQLRSSLFVIVSIGGSLALSILPQPETLGGWICMAFWGIAIFFLPKEIPHRRLAQ